MRARTMTLDKVRSKGLRVLSRELGPYNFIRFLQQFEQGQGDYTKEREGRFGRWKVGDISRELKKQHK